MKKNQSLLIAICGVFLIIACSTPAAPTKRDISFTKYQKINVNVGKIEVIEAYKSPLKAPNVEHIMPRSPADAMQIWVHDRLRATGSDKLLQVTINDASVVATDLPRTKGITGLFTVDQEKRYDARLDVELKIYGEASLSEADTAITVTRSITIPENASVNSRRAAYDKMLNDLMQMLNDKLEQNMQNYFRNYVS